MYTLKLHLMDLPDIIVRGLLQDLSHYLLSVIDIDVDNNVSSNIGYITHIIITSVELST